MDVVFASGESGGTEILVWIKNVGAEKITTIEQSDLFLKTPTEVERLHYNSGGEYWTYVIENGTEWLQGNTIKVTATVTTVEAGLHSFRFIVHNGEGASQDFSI